MFALRMRLKSLNFVSASFLQLILILLSFSFAQRTNNSSQNVDDSPIKTLETVRAENSATNKRTLSKSRETLDHNFIERSSAYNLENLLKQNLLGIDFFQDKIQFNGLDSGANQILYNGIPLIGEDGDAISVNLIDYFFLDSVELMRGSSGALYGSGGAAGAINLIPSRRLFDGQTLLKTDLFYEIHNAGSAKIVAAGRKRNFQWKTGFSYAADDGLTSHIDGYKIFDIPPYHQANTMLDFLYNPSPEDTLGFSLINAYRYSDNPSSISPEYTKIIDKDNLLALFSYKREIDDMNQLETSLSYQGNLLFSDTYVDGHPLRSEDVSDSKGRQLFHNAILHLGNWTTFLPWLSFYIGSDFQMNATDNTLLDLVAEEQEAKPIKKIRYEIAPTLQLLFDFDKTYILSLTARNTYHWTFGYNISPDISFKYNYESLLTLSIDYGRSFVTPSFKENYYKWLHPTPVRFLITGNEHLKPETSDNVSLGLSIRPTTWFNFEGEGFFYRFYDKINQAREIDTSKPGEIQGNYYIGTVETINQYGYIRAGLNAKIKGSLLNEVFFYSIGYSYVYAVEKETKSSPYVKSLMIAPHKISAAIGSVIPMAKTKIEINTFWTDKRKYSIVDSLGETTLKETAYYINLGLSIIQPIYQYFYFYVKLDNILNRKDPNFLTQEGINVLVGFMFKSDDLRLTDRQLKSRTLSWE